MDRSGGTTYKLPDIAGQQSGDRAQMGLQTEVSQEASADLRLRMVDCQIRTFDVTDRAVLARFLDVPRELFVPTPLRELAYSDTALKITQTPGEAERRLLAPMVLARLIQAAGVKPTDRVLDVAPGTGYSTAILAGLAAHVTALESDPDLQATTKSNLAALGLANVDVAGGRPLRDGAATAAPFDVILVNGVVESRLATLFAQLRDGGRLLTLWRPADPADRRASRAVAFEKSAGDVSQLDLFPASGPALTDFRAEPAFTF
jgi:protein-L-isoaspartate(D-aspartate) O-methyltransferase